MMTGSERPIFLLGLGAQKAGTTWLHAYVSRSPGTNFGSIKEYHVWDGLMVPDLAEFDLRRQKVGLRTYLHDLRRRVKGKQRLPLLLRRSMQRDTTRYFEHFARRLAKDGVRLTGDITPSYSALSAETLACIRDGFDRRGITTKAVFLMRDPVERCLSAIRMYRRNGTSIQGVDITRTDQQALLDYVATRQAQLRTNYPHTLEAMKAVFPSQDIYVGLYETMFSPAEVARLSSFLNLPPAHGFVEERFNMTQKDADLDPKTLRRAEAAFASVYDYCLKQYPEVREHWIHASD